MAKLSQILGAKTKVEFEFLDLIQDEAQRDGSPLVRLVLKNPLPVVYGRRINDNATGDSVTLEARDVEMISIGSEALMEIEKLEEEGKELFTWDVEGKSGKFKCNDLKLDVSQQQEVWVVKTSLAQFGRNQRTARRQTQTSNLVSKIREAKTKEEFAGANAVGANKLEAVES